MDAWVLAVCAGNLSAPFPSWTSTTVEASLPAAGSAAAPPHPLPSTSAGSSASVPVRAFTPADLDRLARGEVCPLINRATQTEYGSWEEAGATARQAVISANEVLGRNQTVEHRIRQTLVTMYLKPMVDGATPTAAWCRERLVNLGFSVANLPADNVKKLYLELVSHPSHLILADNTRTFDILSALMSTLNFKALDFTLAEHFTVCPPMRIPIRVSLTHEIQSASIAHLRELLRELVCVGTWIASHRSFGEGISRTACLANLSEDDVVECAFKYMQFASTELHGRLADSMSGTQRADRYSSSGKVKRNSFAFTAVDLDGVSLPVGFPRQTWGGIRVLHVSYLVSTSYQQEKKTMDRSTGTTVKGACEHKVDLLFYEGRVVYARCGCVAG